MTNSDEIEIANSSYVTLVSSDGFEIVILREAACISGMIKAMLAGDYRETQQGRCVFNEINGIILEKVAEYFYYNYKNRNQANVPDMVIPLELCLELFMAADFLDA
ncbi:transcriptional elongation regulator [Blumeria hordei DH14]|uniref:Elongin-C n=1 Tax=Blumeria graminis f. sp. hordei (strain DH14) TaxID=546991 RepID=N1J9Z9_BLUG1|nr:transcriptional elongation regulator [Blumeria hordei DH14]